MRLSESALSTFRGVLVRVRPEVHCADYWKNRPLLVVHERLEVNEIMAAPLYEASESVDAERDRRAALFYVNELDLWDVDVEGENV